MPYYKFLLAFIALVLCSASKNANAGEWEKISTSLFHGFNLEGEIINPKCVELLQTDISENTNIIIRSVILEECQGSNLAFDGQDYAIEDNDTVGFGEGHDYFSYSVLGRLENGDFLIFHGGHVDKVSSQF